MIDFTLRNITLTGLLVLLSACAGKPMLEGPSSVGKISDDASYQGARMDSVAILDRSLHGEDAGQTWYGSYQRNPIGKIAIESSGKTFSPTGTMLVWVTIRNRTNHQQQIECRSSFYDNNQMQIEEPSAWQRVILPQNGVSSCKVSSKNFQGVGHYYIEIREGK